MKTIDEVKDEIAVKNGYENWHEFNGTNKLDNIINEAMQKYARVCCVEQRQLCAEDIPFENPELAKQCILETPLATES